MRLRGRQGMRPFREMPPRRVALIGIGLTVALVVGALFYDRIPGLNGTEYKAYFTEIGNLRSGDDVQISGTKVGKVSSVGLDGTKVRVAFTVDSPVRLGTATRAAIVTTSVLGKRGLRITPAGTGTLNRHDAIPVDRTVSAYSLPDALTDAGRTLTAADPKMLDQALRTVSNVLDESNPALNGALVGIRRLSTTIGGRDDQLLELLARSRSVTAILSQRSNQLNSLALDANQILGQLSDRQEELNRLIIGTQQLATEISGLINDNQQQITPALTKLSSVLDVLEGQRQAISEAIPGLRNFSMSLGESIATGPFFTAYAANLVPVIFLQPLVDALIAQTPLASVGGGR